ncbi:hypothetical protein Q3C01_13630 [Bradyrhizobium sp. UFLA05-109]
MNLLSQRGYVVLVEASWSCPAIKQHGDTGGTKTDFDDRTSLVSQIGALKGAELAYLDAGADHKRRLGNHAINPNL